MGDIVNLRRARKIKARAAKAAEADQNRVRFGLTKAARKVRDIEAGRARRTLDQKKLDDETSTE